VTTPQELDEHFRATIGALTAPDRRGDPSQPVRPDTTLTGATALRPNEIKALEVRTGTGQVLASART